MFLVPYRGTVVVGTIKKGTVKKGDEAELLGHDSAMKTVPKLLFLSCNIL